MQVQRSQEVRPRKPKEKESRNRTQDLGALVWGTISFPAFDDDVAHVGQCINAHRHAVHKQGLRIRDSCCNHLHRSDGTEEDGGQDQRLDVRSETWLLSGGFSIHWGRRGRRQPLGYLPHSFGTIREGYICFQNLRHLYGPGVRGFLA